MITLISPAKSVNFNDPAPTDVFSTPDLISQSKQLITQLKRIKKPELMELMSISENLADLNIPRYKAFKPPFDLENAKQALFAFTGDVYQHMRINTYNSNKLHFAQDHLRILSGLYGYLRPLDLIQAYRLEMKTPLKTKHGDNLYQFWDKRITRALSKDLKADDSPAVINLASKEYARAVDFKSLKAPVVNIEFKEVESGKAKVIAIFAKWARGMMADFIIQNNLDEPDQLKAFDLSEYKFSRNDSGASNWVFTRPRPE
ncbi:MAG: peroxide stress protein YaaA [Candidatus Marinimicrobia bacterium]|nr:peroxide stress protein YaaA [Candidatus Neomarinimicrobiota bacterium]